MDIIGIIAGLGFIFVLVQVFFIIKDRKVLSSKSDESSSVFEGAFNKYCIEEYGKPYNEMSKDEQDWVNFMYCHH